MPSGMKPKHMNNILQKFTFGFFVLLLLAGNIDKCAAQDSCNVQPDIHYLLSYWHSTITTASQPLHYKAKDWLIAGAVIGMTAVAYTQDDVIFPFFDSQFNPKQQQNFTKFTDAFGSGLLSMPLLGGMYLIGRKNDNCRLQEASLAGLQAFVLSAGAAFVLKELTQRPRPNQLAEASKWYGPFTGHSNTAFPSGHSMRAFALATVLAGYYSDKIWVGIGAYSLASLTAAGRLLSGEHWPSDVVAGAVLGYFVGRGVLWANRQIKSQSQLTFKPLINENGLGLAFMLNKKTATKRSGFQQSLLHY